MTVKYGNDFVRKSSMQSTTAVIYNNQRLKRGEWVIFLSIGRLASSACRVETKEALSAGSNVTVIRVQFLKVQLKWLFFFFFYDTTVAKFWSITNKPIAAFFARKFSSGNLTLFSGKIFVFAVKN